MDKPKEVTIEFVEGEPTTFYITNNSSHKLIIRGHDGNRITIPTRKKWWKLWN